MTTFTNIVTLQQPRALRIVPGSREAVVLEHDGRLRAIHTDSGTTTLIADLQSDLIGLDIDAAGQYAYVAGAMFGLSRLDLSGSAALMQLANELSQPSAVRVDDAAARVVVAESGGPGNLVSVSLPVATTMTLASGLQRPQGIELERATGRFLVVDDVDGGRLQAIDPAFGAPVELANGLGAPCDVAWRDSTQRHLIIADRSGRRVVDLDLDRPDEAPTVLLDSVDQIWAARPLSGNLLLVGTGNDLVLAQLEPTADRVQLRTPPTPMFVAAFDKVPVLINDPTVHFDDLEFSVEPTHSGATVSYSRDSVFDPIHPDVMLIAGAVGGPHELVATVRSTGDEVGRAPFDVTDSWTDEAQGPPLSVLGAIKAGTSAGTWGGGNPDQPQNVAVIPAPPQLNVGVVLVETSGAAYPTGAGLQAIINDLRAEIATGVNVGGILQSVASYYDEASNGRLSVNLVDVVGPVALPNAWTSYFDDTPKDDNGDGVTDWFQSKYRDAFPDTIVAQIVAQNQAAVAAGQPPFLDMSQIDSLIFVVRSVPASPAQPLDRFAWPYASIGKNTRTIGVLPLIFGLSVPLHRAMGEVFMPDDWATRAQSGRAMRETLCHELGHNLQLNDLYFKSASHAATYQQRVPGRWDLMDSEGGLPLPSAAHRMMLGWIEPARVRVFDFGVVGPVDELVVLHAAGAGDPTGNRFAAIEIRIADGHNYYFEYRPRVAGRTVDINPPAGSTVFGSDVYTRGSVPSDRPDVLRIRDDIDVDRGEFQTGEDYRESDTTSPQFPNDLIVDIVATAADSATLRVRYGQDRKPDPAIRPWSANSNWQSPDLEVRNVRSQVDPTFRNVPWEGHENRVFARVQNRGKIPATGARVRFGVKDFTFAAGAESSLGDDVRDVATGATVRFTAPASWIPQQLVFPLWKVQYRQHSCVVARIDPYVQGTVVEVTPDNNEAQSNYSWMASTTTSPARRDVAVLQAHNPLSQSMVVSFEVDQPNPVFRTYVMPRWHLLQPGETASVLVMSESLLGDARFDEIVQNHRWDPDERHRLTRTRISALGDTREGCAPVTLGGATLLVITGRGTQFERLDITLAQASGVVVAADTREPVDGPVIVTARPAAGERPEVTATTDAIQGSFRIDWQIDNGVIVQAHYLGRDEFAPCDSTPSLL